MITLELSTTDFVLLVDAVNAGVTKWKWDPNFLTSEERRGMLNRGGELLDRLFEKADELDIELPEW